ncbi:hypothetical protein L1987_21479 [Smallanthus sonchifolius]|uniref:Uncharacterized protein n=1 Tax=Smallanthus sonchifolius TaxID=185202 RepID=A0ACB9IW61_9ASTR|nr:hypothetical protein L1987_21479 [Smallanthus sonchifolius]
MGYLVGYSTMSKAYRVFNKRTMLVEESTNVTFNENYFDEKKSPNWLFDLDTLTKSFNVFQQNQESTFSANDYLKDPRDFKMAFVRPSPDPPGIFEDDGPSDQHTALTSGSLHHEITTDDTDNDNLDKGYAKSNNRKTLSHLNAEALQFDPQKLYWKDLNNRRRIRSSILLLRS